MDFRNLGEKSANQKYRETFAKPEGFTQKIHGLWLGFQKSIENL
jgi:hypothetical protein